MLYVVGVRGGWSKRGSVGRVKDGENNMCWFSLRKVSMRLIGL